MEHGQARAQETPHGKRLRTTRQLSKEKEVGYSTLTKWRLTGVGPAYYKIGRKVLYDEAEYDAWIDSMRRTSTSQDRP